MVSEKFSIHNHCNRFALRKCGVEEKLADWFSFLMSNEFDNEVVNRRSNWSLCLQAFGGFFIVLSIVLGSVMYYLEMGLAQAIGSFIIILIVGVQFSFSGFLVDVFTDIRWFLQSLRDNSEITNQYLDAQFRRNEDTRSDSF